MGVMLVFHILKPNQVAAMAPNTHIPTTTKMITRTTVPVLSFRRGASGTEKGGGTLLTSSVYTGILEIQTMVPVVRVKNQQQGLNCCVLNPNARRNSPNLFELNKISIRLLPVLYKGV